MKLLKMGRWGLAVFVSALMVCAFVSVAWAQAPERPRPRFLPENEPLTLTSVSGMSVDASRGAVMAHVPLPLPELPETFGIEHLVSIQWVNGLQNGPLGPGWHLGIGSISPAETQAWTGIGTPRYRADFPGGGGRACPDHGRRRRAVVPAHPAQLLPGRARG